MKALAFLLGGVLLGVGAHYAASRLSSDAIGLIVGLLFGMLAFLPGFALVLFTRRPQAEEERRQEQARWLLEEERRRLAQTRQAAQIEAQRWQALEQHGARRLTVYQEEE